MDLGFRSRFRDGDGGPRCEIYEAREYRAKHMAHGRWGQRHGGKERKGKEGEIGDRRWRSDSFKAFIYPYSYLKPYALSNLYAELN